MTIVSALDLVFVDLPGRQSADPLRGLDAEVSFRRVRILPGAARTPHRHPHSLELVHVLSGRGMAWQDGQRQLIEPGDTMLVPQGVEHATVAAPGQVLELLCFFPRPDLADNLVELDGPVLEFVHP